MDYKVVLTKEAEKDIVYVDGIFHELQDYENKLN